MYQTPNGLNNALAIADLDAFGDLAEPTQDRLLRQAYRTVAGLAPADTEPRSITYMEIARDAEIAVIQFLITTEGGVLKSSALSGVASESYASIDAVKDIVAGVMGGYYASTSKVSHTTLTNVSPEPLW